MFVDASKQELAQLIYRHLREHGFHTAAEELLRQSPQNDTPPTSVTLLDIYNSWLKSSKRTRKTATSKRSSPDKKNTTHKKAKQKKTTKQQTPNKKTTPAKKKTSGKATENAVPDGGEDSDSDSSLDIEKWKKLVQQMTDTDVAKMDIINALTDPQPKKTRVRKPQTKPPAKSQSLSNSLVEQREKAENATADVSAKVHKTKRSRPKKVATVAFTIDPNQEEIISSETPVTSTVSSSKQTPKKEKRKAVTPTDQSSLQPTKKKKKEATREKVGENNGDVLAGDSLIDRTLEGDKNGNPTEKSEVHSVETKPKKKKKKEATKEKVEDKNGNVVDGDSLIDKNVEAKNGHSSEGHLTEKSKLNPAENEPNKKKKKDAIKEKVGKSGDDSVRNVFIDKNIDNQNQNYFYSSPRGNSLTNKYNNTEGKAEEENGNSTVEDVSETNKVNAANPELESLVKVKKVKKKKKKTEDEGDSGQTVPEADGNTETVISDETNQNTDEMVPKKKKKTKGKKKEGAETLAVENTDVTLCDEDNSEQFLIKKKSKKKKRETLEDVVSEQTGEEQDTTHKNKTTPKTTDTCDGSETLGQTPKKQNKKLAFKSAADTQRLTPSPPQALNLSTPDMTTKKKKSKLESEESTKDQTVSLQVDAASQVLESETPRKKKKKTSKSSEADS